VEPARDNENTGNASMSAKPAPVLFPHPSPANTGTAGAFGGGPLSNYAPWFSADEAKNARNVKSAERTLNLFELFSLHQRPMGVGEIARALQIPQPSVSMLVRNLCQLGYLEHDRVRRTYVPTIRIMLLGSWIHRRFSQEHGLEPWLESLVANFRAMVLMGIQNGIYSQYVWSQFHDDPQHLEIQSGLLRPITCTAVGRALLSLKPDHEIMALVRRCNASVEDERLRYTPTAFMEIIRKVRELGYAQTAGDMIPGSSVIAVTIPGPVGRMPMAVGIGGKIGWIDRHRERIIGEMMRYKSCLNQDPALLLGRM
jgi:DNA-binding IclR family transcriptional regulator